MKYGHWLFGRGGALLSAAAKGRRQLVVELVERGANLNAASSTGYTPLHRAAQNGHVEIVEFLLSRGARPDAAANNEDTPLSLATASKHENIVAMLKGATPR